MLQHSYSLLLFCWTHSSTPKSTRQGLSSTPAPLASPVLSVDGATPHSIPLFYEKDNPKVVTKYDNSDTVVTADLGKVHSHVFVSVVFCFSGILFHINHQTVVVMLVLLFNQESGILKSTDKESFFWLQSEPCNVAPKLCQTIVLKAESFNYSNLPKRHIFIAHESCIQ